MEIEKLIMPNINLSDSEQIQSKRGSYADSLLTAQRFLQALDRDTDLFCFQVFDDLKRRRDPRLAATIHGSLEKVRERLARFNAQGAGVFVAVNAIRPSCERKIENLERIRAIWQDDDAGWNGAFPIAPSIVVRSSPGKFQRYWTADNLKPDLHQAVMRRLVRDFGADPGTRDLVRVLRLPGFFHRKDPANPHRVELIEATGRIYTADEIRAAFPPLWPDPPPAKPKPFNKRAFDADAFGRLVAALSYIPADDREIWYRVGAALRLGFGDAARDLWDGWSATSTKFEAKGQQKAWESFERQTGTIVTLGTIYHLARSYGFREARHA